MGGEKSHRRRDTGRYKEEKIVLKIPRDVVTKGNKIVVEARVDNNTLGHIEINIDKGRITRADVRK